MFHLVFIYLGTLSGSQIELYLFWTLVDSRSWTHDTLISLFGIIPKMSLYRSLSWNLRVDLVYGTQVEKWNH